MADSDDKKCQEEAFVPERPVPMAPDGGWGWVVCFCSFMQSVLVDGVCFSFGLFFTQFLDVFHATKGKTSWAGSSMNGTYLFIGPFASAMVNKFGCRKVAIFGAILASASLFLSVFSPTVDVLIVTYGFLTGTGFGFLYLPAIVIVGHYFDKKRALATGIAVCGSGIGGFVFAPLVELLLHHYNWKGALMILSGIVLNGIVFACFYRPLDIHSPKRLRTTSENVEDINRERENSRTDSCCKNGGSIVFKPSDTMLVESNGKVKCVSTEDVSGNDAADAEDQALVRLALSQDMAHLLKKKNCCERTVHKHFRASEQKDNKGIAEQNGNAEFQRLTRSHDVIPLLQLRGVHKTEERKHMNPLMRKDVFYSGSIQNLPAYKEVGHEKFVEQMLDNTDQVDKGSTDNLNTSDKNICLKLWNIFTSVMDFSLLKSVTFDIYGLSCFLCMTGFFIPFTYLPDMSKEYNISSTEAAMLISIIGITNTVGRIVVGFLSDRSWTDCLLINNIALTLCGISVMLMPFYVGYVMLAVYCVIFGAGIAAFVSLRSIIMVDLMGIEKLTNSFGLVTMCQGLSSYIGSPIAGSLSDLTGSYHAAFYLSGVTLTTAGLICFPLRRIARWERARTERQKKDNKV